MSDWTVIIPARNEVRHIAKCLESLCRQKYDLASVEVIVADNGSTDGTRNVVEQYCEHLDIRILDVRGVRVGAVRNAGAREAHGKWLAFLDADCEPGENWLHHAAELLAEHAALVGASYALPPEAGWPARIWFWRFDSRRIGNVSFLPAGNLLLPADLFWRIGGFNELVSANEDAEFCARARSATADVVAHDRLSVVHHGAERDFAHFVRRQFWHGKGVINRVAFKANLRAIGLASYALICAVAAAAALCLGSRSNFLAAIAALCLPGVALTITGGPFKRGITDGLRLVLLIVTYSLVRAAVLPIALCNGIPQWSRRVVK